MNAHNSVRSVLTALLAANRSAPGTSAVGAAMESRFNRNGACEARDLLFSSARRIIGLSIPQSSLLRAQD
jgi:hypothetical protein